jgi:tmRNA-binding protein
VPLEVYIATKGKIKIKLGVGKLRRKIEKKQILKEKDMDRQMQKEMKNH